MTASAAMTFGEKAKLWSVAVRAYSYPASIVPVVVGSVYAFLATGRFSWPFFILALIAGVAYHTASNLVNDYYDHKHGIDREGTFGGSGVLVSGAMKPREVMAGAVWCLALGTLIGFFFIWHFSSQYTLGWPILAIGAAGFLGTILYTATPLSAKYNALGEPLVFLMMGVGMVMGAYFVQAGTLDWKVVMVSLPVALIVTAILQANDTRDIADDRDSKIRTEAILLGPTGARIYYSILLFGAYAVTLVLCFMRVAPWTALIVILTIPLALKEHKVFWQVRDERHDDLHPVVENTAKLHLAFGLLYAAGIILGRFIG